jgi:transcriptional regulator with XRE-family HTH domain
MPHHIGEDIRALRRSRELTLQSLSAAIGRSVGWLSQIERGQATPSVRDLGRLAEQLGISISFFFRSSGRDEGEKGLIQRQADRVPIGSMESGLAEELLSPRLGGGFEMIRSVFAPGASSEGPVSARGAEHGGVLLEGTLLLAIGEREFRLSPGDSFQFAGQPYAWRNDGAGPAIAVWVISPPVY